MGWQRTDDDSWELMTQGRKIRRVQRAICKEERNRRMASVDEERKKGGTGWLRDRRKEQQKMRIIVYPEWNAVKEPKIQRRDRDEEKKKRVRKKRRETVSRQRARRNQEQREEHPVPVEWRKRWVCRGRGESSFLFSAKQWKEDGSNAEEESCLHRVLLVKELERAPDSVWDMCISQSFLCLIRTPEIVDNKWNWFWSFMLDEMMLSKLVRIF